MSIANYRFGEGGHSVRVNTRHCALDAQSHKLGTNPLDFATPYQVRGNDCTSTRHCEVCEARRGNPVEQRLNLLDCFTTFAMTVIRHSEGVFYPTYQLVLTLPIEVHLPLRRVSLLMLRGFFAPLCSALNDKTVTNFSTFQPFNCSTLRKVVRHA